MPKNATALRETRILNSTTNSQHCLKAGCNATSWCSDIDCQTVLHKCPSCQTKFVTARGLVCSDCHVMECAVCHRPTSYVQMGTGLRFMCNTCYNEHGTDNYHLCYRCSEVKHALDLDSDNICTDCRNFENLIAQGICVGCKEPFGTQEYNHLGLCEECQRKKT